MKITTNYSSETSSVPISIVDTSTTTSKPSSHEADTTKLSTEISTPNTLSTKEIITVTKPVFTTIQQTTTQPSTYTMVCDFDHLG